MEIVKFESKLPSLTLKKIIVYGNQEYLSLGQTFLYVLKSDEGHNTMEIGKEIFLPTEGNIYEVGDGMTYRLGGRGIEVLVINDQV